jgi:hypothetical protein
MKSLFDWERLLNKKLSKSLEEFVSDLLLEKSDWQKFGFTKEIAFEIGQG